MRVKHTTPRLEQPADNFGARFDSLGLRRALAVTVRETRKNDLGSKPKVKRSDQQIIVSD